MEKNKDGKFYFLTRYGHKPHTAFDYSNSEENLYFVFGKESTGIPRDILKPHLDTCMRMPMTDNVRSLNLSNTVAIMTYEALRQQNYNDLLWDEPHKSKNFIEEFEEN
jgi:tRNA (cytidine/uridine-2'-O-)-methyltransferase